MKHKLAYVGLIASLTLALFCLAVAAVQGAAPVPELVLRQPPGGEELPSAPTGVCAASAIPTYALMFTATKDAYVNQEFPSNNYGTADLYVGKQRRALVQFDLSALPANAVVVSATLELYEIWNLARQLEATAAMTVEAQAVLASWDESTVTWNNQPVAESRGDPVYTLVSAPTYDKMDVAKIAQAWKSGSVVNNGILIRNDTATTYYGFESRNSYNTHKPRLMVVYHTCAKPLTGASVSGPTQGVTNTGYTFNSTLFPLDATTPITYRWTATDYTCGFRPNPPCPVGASATFTWTVLGVQTVTLTAKNCSGETFTATHTINISNPVANCTFPLTSLTLNGPTTGITGTNYVYTASASRATYPITYTWQATDQTPRTTVVSATKQVTTFNWLLMGDKLITVTAQNCGGAATANRAVSIVNPAQLPDLVITNAWYESDQSRVGYLIKNIGGGTAYAGHTTELFQGDTSVAQQVFDQDLTPGAIRAGYINYAWSCGTLTSTVRLKADSLGDAGEQSESNNEWQSVWQCDLQPPVFTTVPTVTATSETTAVIQWSTNENTTGLVQYDTRSSTYSFRRADATSAQNHQVTLTSLEAGQTYHHTVIVTDAAGLRANSADRTFATQPVGTDPPQIKSIGLLEYPSDFYEFYILQAVLTQTQGIDRVSFFLDGQLIGGDHTPDGNVYEVYLSPAARGMTRDDWFKSHTLQVQAYNLENEAAAQVKNVTPASRPVKMYVSLNSLKPGDTLLVGSDPAPSGTTLTVTLRAYQYEWKCTGESAQPTPPGIAPVTCNDALRRSVFRMMLLWDNAVISGAIYTPPSGVLTHTFQLNLAGTSLGAHTLEARAMASDGTSASRQQTIKLEQGTSYVDVTRQVTRVGNTYRIQLTLKNIGNLDAHVDKLQDSLMGFQVVRKAFGSTYTVNASYNHASRESTVTLDLKNGAQSTYTLAPGAQHTIEYVAVPILYETDVDHSIGYESGTQVYYTVGSGTYLVEMPFFEPEVIWSQISDALETSNYLLVTNPGRLVTFTNAAASQEVLALMAHLAYLKNGVLGYLDTYCSATLDALLESGGAWADALHPDFRAYDAKGYVLLVGENEIIPTQDAGYGVQYSDLRYASTSGEAKPELVLGRVIGNDAYGLTRTLQTSIGVQEGWSGYGFDRSHALLYSGRGEGAGIFWDDVREVDHRIDDEFAVTRFRGTDYATESDLYVALQGAAPGADLIFYSGHGNPASWHALSAWPGVPNLGISGNNPVVMGLACSTGEYEGADGDDWGIAEAFLRHGAGVYVGATDTSYTYPDSDSAKAFFNRWDADESVGYILTDVKRDKWGNDSDWKMWAYEYHLYGDPKYGVVSSLARSASAAPQAPAAAQASVQAHIPDYETSLTEDGLDAVEIPDGSIWIEDGQYRVPYWVVSLDYPKGSQVQAVTMTERTGEVATTGLHLPTTTMVIRCAACAEAKSPLATQGDADWFPNLQDKYTWTVEQNPDGSTTLTIMIYPLYYNAQTTDILFYQDYGFDVLTTTTEVEITSLRTNRAAYRQGEKVSIDLTANNSGAPQNVIVAASVKTLSDVTVDGLPLQSLGVLTGTVSAYLEWNTTGFAAGGHSVMVELRDGEGNVLDREVREFTLGVAEGQVTALTASPRLFKIGNSVNMTLTFQNTGDMPITGTAIIQIAHTGGLTSTAVFTHSVTNLTPGNTITVANTWATTGQPEGDYAILGYIMDGGQVLGSKTTAIGTRTRVYLPIVIR